VPDGHLCCGSAGTYSITQPELSARLLANKVDALESGRPELIATANIGCQLQIGGGTKIPVVHWLELLDG
jgi:glycolate oxidase iron-sulfur subunit